MNSEEKEIKKSTTPKKRSTKKVETKKTTTKSNATKKTTVKKVTPKKSVEKKPVPKKIEKKEEVKVISEPKAIKEEQKVTKESKTITKDNKPAKASKELIAIRRKRHIIEAVIILVLVIIALIILLNRTFLKTSYSNDNITVSVPRFSYYVSDNDNKVKFITLRKASYLTDYYNEYLEGFTFYSCGEGTNTFYYNEGTHSLIKEIKIESNFGIKTVEITYETRSPEEVCGLM